ncbi:diguanylate cyclase [Candidatus Fermentibacteria bacterium]|nr:diguanylate cyclase [Candidatus Fermentibacteria bacterium]
MLLKRADSDIERTDLDAVTGLPPRNALDNELPEFLRAMGRKRLPLSAIMVDVDDFKAFNDTYGHDVGDRVLRHVCSLIGDSVRYRGEAYRYGGEEITVLLPNADPGEALATATRICRAVRVTPLVLDGGDSGDSEKDPLQLTVTISLGVSSFPSVSGDQLLVTADSALLQAKRNGKDQAVSYEGKLRSLSEEPTTVINVRFPGLIDIKDGGIILLSRWFSHLNDPTELEAREISQPGRKKRDMVEGPAPKGGMATSEIRGRASDVERQGKYTFFSFEVESEVLELIVDALKHLKS